MRKLKSCSFYFLTNSLIRKFIFVLFISAIFNGGFFVSSAFAEEETTEDNFTLITDDIMEDTIWTKEGSPYVISNSIMVGSEATLTIEPGVVIKFDADDGDASIYISGKMIANGTVEEPVYFTSIYDDIGGSTDEDYEDCYYEDYDEELNGIGEEICEIIDWYEPSVGDWRGLYFLNSINSDLKNVFFKYMGNEIYLESSSVNFLNLNISDSDSGIVGGKGNNIKILGGEFNNLDEAFVVYDDSFLEVEDISIKNTNNGFTAYISHNYKKIHSELTSFNNSILEIRNLDIECKKDGIVIFNNYSLDIKDSDIRCSSDGIVLFNEVKAIIDNVKISGSQNSGIIGFNNTKPNTLKVINSEITGNNYGFVVFDTDYFSAHRNSIHDNFSKGVDVFSVPSNLDFTNNWWGDVTGPKHKSNTGGLGNSISNNILFSPWLLYDPLLPRKDPVILIPGITGSYLHKDYGDKEEIWPNVLRLLSPTSITDEFLNDLALNLDGTQKTELPIITGDIIRGIASVHVFDYLIDKLKEDGYVEGVDLFVFPYDWRLSTESTAILLNEKINTILLNQEFNKVDIIAHSMGGLVAKKYIANNSEEKIDQLIFLGTPQLGSPKAFKVLMFGDDMSYQFLLFLGLKPSRAKYISQNMPSVYELLPSQKYVDLNGNYIERLFNKLIHIDLNYEGVKDLMIEKGRNPLMFPFAESLHDSIDNLDLSSIDSYNFIGCNSPTIGQIKFEEETSWLGKILGDKEDFKIGYTDGDETVPLVSARESIGTERFYVHEVSHGSLPASESVMKGILSILNDEAIIFDDVLKDDDTYCGIKGDVVSTHSPVQIHVYDEDGNHTGPNENGDIEYGVLGVAYDVFDDVNYVFLPDGKNYKIITKATDIGGFNLKIEEQEDEIISKIHNWTLVPLSSIETTGEIWIGPDYKALEYELKIDSEGDGVFENNYKEGFDGTSLAEQTTTSRRSSGSYLKPKPYLQAFSEIIEPIEQNKNPMIVQFQDNKKINANKEEIVLQEEAIKQQELSNQEEQQVGDERDNDLLASAGNSSFKNKNLLWIGAILLGLIFGVLAKRFKKL